MLRDTDIILYYLQLVEKIKDHRASKYLIHGFNARTRQIKETKFQLSENIKKADGPSLDPYTACHNTIFLNSFYLNVAGALDNLAWIIQHEFNIIEGADEKSKKRNKVVLYHKEFLEGLKKIDASTVDFILQYYDWYKELKEFRDPAAHRIPLLLPHGIIFDNHKQDYDLAIKNLDKQSNNGDPRLYTEALHNFSNMGVFQPVFISFNEVGVDNWYLLLRTIEHDYENFWKTANIILSFFNKKLSN